MSTHRTGTGILPFRSVRIRASPRRYQRRPAQYISGYRPSLLHEQEHAPYCEISPCDCPELVRKPRPRRFYVSHCHVSLRCGDILKSRPATDASHAGEHADQERVRDHAVRREAVQRAAVLVSQNTTRMAECDVMRRQSQLASRSQAKLGSSQGAELVVGQVSACPWRDTAVGSPVRRPGHGAPAFDRGRRRRNRAVASPDRGRGGARR
jgi:hypothetical protein